jgi:hypothetical protein
LSLCLAGMRAMNGRITILNREGTAPGGQQARSACGEAAVSYFSSCTQLAAGLRDLTDNEWIKVLGVTRATKQSSATPCCEEAWMHT